MTEHATDFDNQAAMLFEEAALQGMPEAVDLFKALARVVPPTPPQRPKFAPPQAEDWEHDVRDLHPDEHDVHLRHHEGEFRGLMGDFHRLDPQAEDHEEQKRGLVQRMRKVAQHWQRHRLAKHAPKLKADAGKVAGKLRKAIGAPVVLGETVYTVEQHQRDRKLGPDSGRYMDPETRRAKTHLEFRGLPIRIETNAGEVRRFPGGECTMRYPYGEIEGTLGADGDPVDVFIGPDFEAEWVWVFHIHDKRVKEWPGGCCPKCGNPPADCRHDYDEDKCFLGFNSEHECESVFKVHYDTETFVAAVTRMSFGEFYGRVLTGAPLFSARPVDLIPIGTQVAKGGPALFLNLGGEYGAPFQKGGDHWRTEPRDSDGKWTSGGPAAALTPPPEPKGGLLQWQPQNAVTWEAGDGKGGLWTIRRNSKTKQYTLSHGGQVVGTHPSRAAAAAQAHTLTLQGGRVAPAVPPQAPPPAAPPAAPPARPGGALAWAQTKSTTWEATDGADTYTVKRDSRSNLWTALKNGAVLRGGLTTRQNAMAHVQAHRAGGGPAPAPPQHAPQGPTPAPQPPAAPKTPWAHVQARSPRSAARYGFPAAYVPQGTVAGVEKWLQQQFPHIQFTLKGLDLACAHNTAEQVVAMANRYPAVVKYGLKEVGTKLPPGHRWSRRVMGYWFPGQRGIYLNPAHFKDAKALGKTLRYCAKTGFHPPGGDRMESVFLHEFGHAVDSFLRHQQHHTHTPVIDGQHGSIAQIQHEVFAKRKDGKPPTISDYAKTNADETWAEGFQMVHLAPAHKWPPLVQKQAAWLQQCFAEPTYERADAVRLHRLTDPADQQAGRDLISERRKPWG